MSANRFPPPLKPGGTIGILSPARWPEPEWLEQSKAAFEAKGYKVVIHPQNFLKEGQMAGSDADRAGALNDMFADKNIDAILCSRGGCNAIRILDKLDYKLIKKNPKPFIGYSDISLLQNAITKKCGFVTYHGPLGWNFGHDPDPRVLTDMLALLISKTKHFTCNYDVDGVRPGSAQGVLVGGNITRLELLMSTDYDWSGDKAILFIEDVDEVLYKLDEKLQHLRLAGRFDKVRAVIVGEMIDVADGENGFAKPGQKPYGRTFRQIVESVVPADVPLCFDFPCGHGRYITTLPIGAETEITITPRSAQLIFKL
ncbi:MAG TPA: LD-carboxypeptidase [Alphaproteobacteria bacterium]|nr:LD-carboxypeptidase [Alphaproteobacteria bacterium]